MTPPEAPKPRPSTRVIASRPVRFMIVGAGSAGAYFVLSYVLQRAGLAAVWAAPAAYVTVCVFGYLLQRSWTFGATAGHRQTLPRFISVQAICMAASSATGAAAHALGQPALVISAITTVVVSAASYVASRYWVFAGGR